MFEISLIPAFKDNYIWLLSRGQQAFVVDPGDASPVLARLSAEGLTLAGILVTHHHADHQGGIAQLLEQFPCDVFAPAEESITGRTHALRGGERLPVLGVEFEVLALPGHTLGHLGYRAPGVLFCGDVLFGAGCGRLFEGSPEQMHASLARIAALPDETLVYCAHEYTAMNLPFAQAVEPDNARLAERVKAVTVRRLAGEATVPLLLGEEKATNPFLRCQVPAVVQAARLQGAVDTSPVAVFAALRRWRNGF